MCSTSEMNLKYLSLNHFKNEINLAFIFHITGDSRPLGPLV